MKQLHICFHVMLHQKKKIYLHNGASLDFFGEQSKSTHIEMVSAGLLPVGAGQSYHMGTVHFLV